MGFELRELDIEDISRAQKQNVRSDIQYDNGTVTDELNPLKGNVRKQHKRVKDVADILNIGAGTRCKHCGFLHFMWRETCGGCERPMEYNLGHRDEEARL
jgi:hypothetical protein